MASWGECSRGLQLSHAPVLDRKRLAVATPSIEKANQWRFCSGLNKQDQVDVQAEINRKVELPTEKCEGKDRSDLSSSITMEKKEADPSSLEEREQHVDGGTEKDRDANELDCSHSTSHVQHLTDIKPVNDLVQCVLVMSDSAIRRLKIEAGEGYTSLEVLCAHFWQRISIAKKAGPGECTYLLVPINYRDRIKQPLPATYFGNVIGYSVVVTIASKIREQPLGATTSRIHAQLLADKCGSIEPFMHWLETHDNCLTPLWLSSPMVHYNGVNVASSPWFPAYEVDFGWDKPAAVRAAKVSWI
ncbi:hypothetical protein KP509_14G063800 [Ceratopteris richardii]|nr:hypothetical protein KP509_14G063800 [Ceratopteris richardii]